MENNQGSFYRNNGSYSSSFGGGGTSGYASWTTNDIVGVAIDFDSGKIWYAKNNSWQSGDPATGNSPTNTFTTGRTLLQRLLLIIVLALNLDRLIMDKDRLLIPHQQVINQCALQTYPTQQ